MANDFSLNSEINSDLPSYEDSKASICLNCSLKEDHITNLKMKIFELTLQLNQIKFLASASISTDFSVGQTLSRPTSPMESPEIFDENGSLSKLLDHIQWLKKKLKDERNINLLEKCVNAISETEIKHPIFSLAATFIPNNEEDFEDLSYIIPHSLPETNNIMERRGQLSSRINPFKLNYIKILERFKKPDRKVKKNYSNNDLDYFMP